MMLVIVIALLVFLITLWRRDYGLAAVIVLWPSYLLRTTLVGVPTTALELSIYALVVARLIQSLRHHDVIKPQLSRAAWLFVGLWVAAWALATAFSSDHQASLGAFKAWLVDPLLFGLVLMQTIRAANQRKIVVSAAAFSGAIVALGGLAQLVWFRGTLQDNRLSSFFHPVANYAAMYLAPLLVMTIGAVMWKLINRWWWIAVGVMLIALILTVSFGGYLSLGVGLAVLWWRWPNRRTKGAALMIGAIVVVLGLLALSRTPYLAEKFTAADRSSSLVRSQIWRTSIEMIKEHPLFGIGPNAYEPVYRATIPKLYFPPLEWLVSQPHQLFLALWLETGLLGLLTFVAGMVWWFRTMWFRLRRADEIAIIATAAMAAIIVHGFVDTPLFKNDLMMLFAFVALLPFLKIDNSKN